MELYIARDKDWSLNLFNGEPKKTEKDGMGE